MMKVTDAYERIQSAPLVKREGLQILAYEQGGFCFVYVARRRGSPARVEEISTIPSVQPDGRILPGIPPADATLIGVYRNAPSYGEPYRFEEPDDVVEERLRAVGA